MKPGAAKRALVPIGAAALVWGHVSGRFLHWSCPVRVLLHVPCPTCGLTTATRAMVHLHFTRATHVHPLALVVVPVIVGLVAFELAGFVVTGRFGVWTDRKPVRVVGLALCIALFVVWVARFWGAFGGPDRV